MLPQGLTSLLRIAVGTPGVDYQRKGNRPVADELPEILTDVRITEEILSRTGNDNLHQVQKHDARKAVRDARL